MSENNPSKTDIQQVFKRLRSHAPNKVCYDCGSKNPTWASITYGIFICIDCSGIHRSLGVHLTFIRSTNLDTNWSWQQLRQMQLGGNAKALTFFRGHNCTTTDTQQKYNSRAAQLYREQLQKAGAQAMRLHGTKLHIEGPSEEIAEQEKTEDDFFANADDKFSAVENVQIIPTAVPTAKINNDVVSENGGPDVSKLTATTAPSGRKPTIGARKPGAKKPGGLGGKKGLGATKVTKDFSQIEKEAEMADNLVVARKEEAKAEAARTKEEEAAQMASMRLAYQDLSVQQKKNEEKLAKMDPKKAQQSERLGMGFGGGGLGSGSKSHSLVSDMGVITQEEPSNAKKPQFQSSTKDKFFDDFEVVEPERDSDSGWGNSKSRIDEICAASSNGNSGLSAWEQDLNDNISKSASKSSTGGWDNDFESKPKKSSPVKSSNSGPSGDEASKKFGNAKSISSDMFFGGASQDDRDANLTRFQGSNSISSDMYFGRETPSGGSGVGGGGMGKSSSNYSLQAPDMDDVKESVRQGVSKLGGRLSGMASGVMSQIQDKYGY